VDLSRARLAVAASFATQGLVFISLTTRLNEFQDRWRLSELDLSLLLLMMVLLAGAGSVAAERLAARRDSATLLRAGLLLGGVALVVLATAPEAGVFVGGLAAYGVALGVVDATTNMQAVALEHRFGRPILPSFHGAWTLGGILGASLTLATGELPLEVAAGLAVVPLVVALGPLLPRDQGVAVDDDLTDVAWRPILLVGLGLVVFYMVDTAATTWGATYLDDVFTTPDRLVALATLPYLVATLCVRMAGDRLVARFGAAPVLRAGALVACLGLVVVVSAPVWPVAVLGFTITGAGVAVIAPLSFSAAARIAGGSQTRVDAVIGRFNQFNYVGALLGAVLTGVVGQDSLRIGFAVPMVLVLAMLPLAKAFAPSAPSPATPSPTP
jgi:fucose permease